MQYKVCSKCKVNKPFSSYYLDTKRKIGIRCKCKECCSADTYTWRDRNRSEYNNYVAEWRAKNPDRQHATEIKRHYGLSIEQYNELLTAQRCRCAICGYQHDPSLKRGRLYVDHCHNTGTVRSLLCKNCNNGLGHFKDNPDLLEKAAAYLLQSAIIP